MKDSKKILILEEHKRALEEYIGTRNVAETLKLSKVILKDGSDLGLWEMVTSERQGKFPTAGTTEMVWKGYEAHLHKSINFGMEIPNTEQNFGDWVLELGKKLLTRIKEGLREAKEALKGGTEEMGPALWGRHPIYIVTAGFVAGIMLLSPEGFPSKRSSTDPKESRTEPPKKGENFYKDKSIHAPKQKVSKDPVGSLE